jgi:hypothetical protein
MIDDECGTIGGMRIGRRNQSTRRKPEPEPLCPPQNPHDLNWARTRAAAVGSRRLTAWAMGRPNWTPSMRVTHTGGISPFCQSMGLRYGPTRPNFTTSSNWRFCISSYDLKAPLILLLLLSSLIFCSFFGNMVNTLGYYAKKNCVIFTCDLIILHRQNRLQSTSLLVCKRFALFSLFLFLKT